MTLDASEVVAVGLDHPQGVVGVAARLSAAEDFVSVAAFDTSEGRFGLVLSAVMPAPCIPEWQRAAWLAGVLCTALCQADVRRLEKRLTTRLVRSATVDDLALAAREYARLDAPAPQARGHRGVGRVASVAARYVELLSTSSCPVKDLAAELGLSRTTVSSYLHQARQQGLLTSPGRGRPGGELVARDSGLVTDSDPTLPHGIARPEVAW